MVGLVGLVVVDWGSGIGRGLEGLVASGVCRMIGLGEAGWMLVW